MRERRRIAVRIVLIVVLLLSLVGGALYALTWEGFRIQDIIVSTNGALPVQEVTDLATGHINESSLLFVPRTSVFLLDVKGLQSTILNTFPRVESVKVRRTSITSAVIQIRERAPEALWCGDVVPPVAYARSSTRGTSAEEAWGTCYLLDHSGYIYARAPVYTGSQYPRYYGSLEKAQPVGQHFIETSEFTTLQHFFDVLEKKRLEPIALLLLDERDMEVYLGNGLRIIAARDHAPEALTNRIHASLEAEVFDLSRRIDYADFRFGSKVFVKYKDTLDNNTAVIE
jgi:cell division septal protein FtsQ